MSEGNDRFVIGLIAGVVFCALVGVSTEIYLVEPMIVHRVQQADQREAVKANAGRWISDESGAPKFAWKSCNALGVPQ